MNSKKKSKIGVLFCVYMLLISVNANSTNTNKYVSIEKHILNNSLIVNIQGIGGHSAHCIQVNANNLTSDTLYVYVEPGRRLVSKDTTIQDIFIVKENKIIILPYDKSTFLVYGFCCQSSNSSPYSASVYTIGHMAPPDWITLAKIINENTFPTYAIQSAVWVISNNHPISSISSNDMESIYDWIVKCRHEESIHTSEAIAVNWKGIPGGFNGRRYL
jgi:hypothetical protein